MTIDSSHFITSKPSGEELGKGFVSFLLELRRVVLKSTAWRLKSGNEAGTEALYQTTGI
jgi:hypothetical protein